MSAMHYITFFAFFTVAASLPTFSPTLSRQSIFKHAQASDEEHQYPPYHDPRLLGGRLLDVRSLLECLSLRTY